LSHGQSPFFRLPTANLHDLPSDTDVAIVGVPYDGGTTYLPGARFAPYHVRRVSAVVQSYNPCLGVDTFAVLKAVDAGNVVFPPFQAELVRAAIFEATTSLVSQGAIPFFVGGDHSITLPILRALAKVHGPLGVVHVDAHLDTSTGAIWGNDFHHGTPFRHALAEGLIADRGLVQLGIRGAWGSRDEDAPSQGADALIVRADAIHEGSISQIMREQVWPRLEKHPVYLSFDIDGVDPAFAPGTGTPVPGGLTSHQALTIVRALAGLDIVGADLVEVSPAQDHADMSCHLASAVLFEAASAIAKGRI
jgi:agmatinase